MCERALGPFGRVPSDLAGEVNDVDELVGLPAKFVSDHRRLRADGGDHRNPYAAPLHRLYQRPEVAVAREQDHVVDVRCELQGVDRELDVHVALDLAPAGRVDELLGRLRDHPVAVVIEPVDQRADG